MKTIVIYILCMILSGITFGQIEKEKMEHKKIEEVKVVPPKFTGITNVIQKQKDGEFESIEDYLAKNIQYPEKDAKNFNQGTEVVQFMVNTDGKLTDFTIINSVSPQIDKEVIWVLKTTNGMWLPGDNNGKPVAMGKEVSVAFKLNSTRHPLDFEAQGRKYFSKGSELLLTQNNPKKAVKFYDKGIKLLPSDKGLLLMRGFAMYGAGNLEGAMRDWQRIIYLGGTFSDEYLTNLHDMKGYAELINVLNE
ncbi:MAG TPA: energy transducer TonB [Draconibacterium sp.]|nr:energy transducer TonB [Draconibacterium sp.]